MELSTGEPIKPCECHPTKPIKYPPNPLNTHQTDQPHIFPSHLIPSHIIPTQPMKHTQTHIINLVISLKPTYPITLLHTK